MAAARMLVDHDEIRAWAEAREAIPSAVEATASDDDPGIIRLDFPGYSGEGSLYPISWDDWFAKLDENDLALLVQDETSAGQRSNFNKIVKRQTAEASSGRGGRRKSGGARSAHR
jgi:hypothetical protein